MYMCIARVDRKLVRENVKKKKREREAHYLLINFVIMSLCLKVS